ncbi:MAG: hypothetical protein C6H99_02070 [Epsilonproteobacteria bacterium]|nr:hypothetical protein [Campylobacterota bacterium]NPA63869.1 hypothetical protein [Campylobacterota bacterium]
MTIYFYAHTDNRRSLRRLRRSAALAKELQKEFDVYFMTTEFRSATYARRELGIKKAVGIEDFRNIGTIAQRGDVIVYDSDEHSEVIHEEMIEFFGTFFRISYDPKTLKKDREILISPHLVGEGIINGLLIDRDFFDGGQKSLPRGFFYGDDDYGRELEKIAPKLASFELELIEGFYFFVDVEEKIEAYFKAIHPIEEYFDVIKASKTFLSFDPQTALEAAAAGARTLFIHKEAEEEYTPLIQRAGVLDGGYFDPARLQEALLRLEAPNRDYLSALSVEKVAREMVSILKTNT